MQEFVMVTGMIIQSIPMNEYDKRVTILTKERGKISAFAKGAKRPTSKLAARTNVFCFGEFKLFPGKSSYNLLDAEISNYFDSFLEDMEGAMFGMYFLDIANYYTRENNDERSMLLLLYQSLRALQNKTIPNRLVQYIYEMKALVVNGEFPGIPPNKDLLSDTSYTIDYVVRSNLEKLYTFVVSDEVLMELSDCSVFYRSRFEGKNFKSLEILDMMV